MRRLAWVSVLVLASACSGTNGGPAAPTPITATAPAVGVPPRSSTNMTPFVFPNWVAGMGEMLTLGVTVSSNVVSGDVCVAGLRTTWDWRASCRRYALRVAAPGRLDAFLRWDANAAGFDPTLVGDVVLITPNGHFNASPGAGVDEHTWALVEPGSYGVVVMSYVDVNLPYMIRTELTTN